MPVREWYDAPVNTARPPSAFATASATATSRLAAPLMRRTWPLRPLAPAFVLVLGVAVAIAIGFFGVDQLAREGDESAAARSDLLAATLGARLARMAPDDRLAMIKTAARATHAEILFVTREGDITADATLTGMSRDALRRLVETGRGEALTKIGLARFATRPLEPPPATHFLVAFVNEPSAPEGAPALIRALIALTTLLVGVAAVVAYAVVRDANREVEFVGQRVRGMVHVGSAPTGESVPVRTIDEVGALTSSFNELVARFAAADKKYKADLERVRAADRDRAAFLAAVSHELRSPLNAILGFSDVLMTEVDGPISPNAREEVEQIRGSGQHLLDLINDILEFSALESGQLKLSRARVDLTSLAAEVVREGAGSIHGRPVELRCEGLPDVVAHVDAKRIRQVLTNLVANAIKFTQQGEVVVSVARDGRYVRVTVRDTGPGINAAERAVIFEEYKQTKEEQRKRRGTGLGLAIARRLVLMHAGTISLESEIGRGSTFKVLLPGWNEASVRPSAPWKVRPVL